MKRADLFLSGGRPFRSMSEPGLTALKELTALRNVLAHDSRHSRKQFERVVLSQRAVPSYERTVDRYLLGIDIAPSSRLETHLARVVAAFEELV